MLKQTDDGVFLFVKVIPKASSNTIVGCEAERLKVKVTAVPEKGKANQAVIKLLAKELGISKSAMTIVSGEVAKLKTILIKSHSIDDLGTRLTLYTDRD
jgi:uncharacterized protein